MNMIRKSLLICVLCLAVPLALAGCSDQSKSMAKGVAKKVISPGHISSKEDINLRSDNGADYTFTFNEEDFNALFSVDTWTIYNSYRITNSKDIKLICQALLDEHEVPGRDRQSVRTASDMAFEWEQHNLAYEQLPEDNSWRESARNVDLDPDDQGKTFKEIYEERTGKTIELEDVYEKKDKIIEKIFGESETLEKIYNNKDQLLEKIKEKVKEYLKEALNRE